MGLVSLGAILQCSAYSVPQLMIGRFITGLGVGVDTSTVPMYQAELCKPEVRGRLVTTEVFFVALGVSSAYFLDFGFSFISGPVAWRVPIIFQIPLALLVSVLVIGLPETPRWLWQQGRTDEAISVMVKVHDVPESDPYVVQEREEIMRAIEIESSSPFKWSRIFKRDALQTGWRVWLACLVLFMNQVSCSVTFCFSADQDNSGLELMSLSSISHPCLRAVLGSDETQQSLLAVASTWLSRPDPWFLLWVRIISGVRNL